MTTTNPDSGNEPGFVTEELRVLNHNAVFLHAFAQGVDALLDTIKMEISPAANSIAPLMEDLIKRAQELANDIDWLKSQTEQEGL